MGSAEKVKNNGFDNPRKQALSSPPKLDRITFRTSRAMDFFSEKELVTQTGHEKGQWPLVAIKELVDNALDACEDKGIAPVIRVEVDETGIMVCDNGPGLPDEVLRGAMNFTIRVSNREAYVSPCRGAQGNALKTLIPMPGIIDPERGRFVVTAHGKRHEIRCAADPISQEPKIHDDVTDAPKSKNQRFAKAEKASFLGGTVIRLEWSESTEFVDQDDDRPPQLIESFALFNPHATFRINWFGTETTWNATDPTWAKWLPSNPTSSHWYEPRHFERLIGANISHGRDMGTDRLVSDFIAEFDGLTGSAKRAKVLDRTGLRRARLSELANDVGLDSALIAKLLAAMQENTRPVVSKRLGIIGEPHLRQRLLAMGVVPKSFCYKRTLSKDKVPSVLEFAFGWLGDHADDERRDFVGANWSAAIGNPFRSFGDTGEGLETVLANCRATRSEPIVIVLHLAHPRLEYTDRGKSALVIA